MALERAEGLGVFGTGRPFPGLADKRRSGRRSSAMQRVRVGGPTHGNFVKQAPNYQERRAFEKCKRHFAGAPFPSLRVGSRGRGSEKTRRPGTGFSRLRLSEDPWSRPAHTGSDGGPRRRGANSSMI